MLRLRKTDAFIQIFLALIALTMLPARYDLSLFTGLFAFSWQLASAGMNTFFFMQTGFQRRIRLYWSLCLLNFLLVAGLCCLNEAQLSSLSEILLTLALPGIIGTAIYYWIIYFRLIKFISLRNELDGLTKSKHRS